ncbi:MAG: methyltransferase domain-containing protein [Desulfobulbaceae bacterium]|uniref:Malonyl-[acyl-carrier protein] O-methyltransferase n=1 Tax=Candidatus Desulfatifera sulfidica TaxID=2841691 RepID=A0A8J6TDV5_9BACT|nr:methyltransferase domain-containing protein [Candidatus Desulfatifera sulfidica]
MPDQLDKGRIRRSFQRSRATYDEHATIQQQAGVHLLKLLGRCAPVSVERCLEIGCCTGVLSELFCSQFQPEALFLNDLVDEFVAEVPSRLPENSRTRAWSLPGDIEQVPLPEDLSLVLSSSTFQWLVDLPLMLTRLAESLRPGGLLAVSLFGPGTLSEFSSLTNVGLNYRSKEAISQLLERDFVIEAQESQIAQSFFSHPRAVLEHLRATGVGGVTDFRWTKDRLREFERDYQSLFGTPEGVPVTYATLYFVARRL